MPIVLLLMGAATLALVASNSYAKTPKSARSPYNLDPHLDPQLRAQVEAALNSENDPSHLEAFAHALDGRFPYAAWYLRAKAAGLRRMGLGTSTTPALPPVAPQPRGDGLDGNLPDSVRFNVVELLTMGTDAAQIEGFAAQLSAYPMAQAALRLRAAFLRSSAPQPSRPAIPGVPSPSPPAPAPTLPSLPGFDPGMPPELAMHIAQVLMTENDPAKLRELGNAILQVYPTAATMLLGKANGISPQGSAQQSPGAPPAPVFVPSAPPAPGPVFMPPTPSTPPTATDASPMPQIPPQFAGLFDANMTPDDQAHVVVALSSETDPNRLRQLADAIASHYPKAALLLTNKAAAISALMMPGQAPPAVPVVFNPPAMLVRSYKVQQGDFPIKIAKKYGRAESEWKDLVAANPQKPRKDDGNFKQLLPGEVLTIPALWPDHGQDGPSPAPAQVPNAPAPAGAIVPPGAAALDPGMPGNVAQAVLTALATETDAAVLRGFASSVMATYPIAAGVLLAKANTVGVFANLPGGAPAAMPGASGATPVVFHPPSGAPATGARTYKVVNGDSPSRIAKKLTGNDGRWPELVAANPQKPKQANGNFKSLQPGDVLQVPATWPVVNGAPAPAARA